MLDDKQLENIRILKAATGQLVVALTSLQQASTLVEECLTAAEALKKVESAN